MRFTLDALPDRSWQALAFGEPWNGWATPIVARDVFSDVLNASGEPHRWAGDDLWLGTPAADLMPGETPDLWNRIEAEEAGTYALAALGWTFVAIPESAEPSHVAPCSNLPESLHQV
ncbi:hypothetical protein [Antricoccus suffuscus]|nr:hypothetical protein [Antricoccus suffuscus]